MLWHISKWFLSPPSTRSIKGFFSDIHCEEFIELLQVKLRKVCSQPQRQGLLRVLSSQTCPLWASSNSTTRVVVSLPQHCSPWRFLLLQIVIFVSTCLSLQYLGQQFALWPHFSEGYKKCSWFFSLFNFLLVMIEWQLLGSLHDRLEPKSSKQLCFHTNISLAYIVFKWNIYIGMT